MNEEYNEMNFGGCGGREDGCSTVNYQYANISVPINVTPKVKTGEITLECCEEPVIECCTNECKNGLDIVIIQKVCIKIPVKYQLEACVEEEHISCCD